MADKTPKVVEEVGDDARISMTASELKQMLANSQIEAAKLIADALKESRKPFVDERQKENDELFRQGARQQEERRRAAVQADQATCTHLQGSNPLSEKTGDLTSWSWHRYDDGVIRGICTNCQRLITPEDHDYVYEFRRKSGNRISSAGLRMNLVPMVAQTAPTPVTKAAPAVDKETVTA